MTYLNDFFVRFRKHIIGHERIIYADWTASGRAYRPIEEYIQNEILPFVGNTHTSSTTTGRLMSAAYSEAKQIIRNHVHANDGDALIFCGSGMTAAVNKLQRILGWRVPERVIDYLLYKELDFDESLRPLVFITHMEHHSNHISWLETIATVEIFHDLQELSELLEKNKHRKNKVAAVTACSNVTGIETDVHAIAKMMHEYSGLCFVDFACSAPYVDINMHPVDSKEALDAIYFSCHKFLGGPGTPGVLVFNKNLYKNTVPDQPGGGTVLYTNPWKELLYVTDIEEREDGGTPPFLQAIKAGMCIRLKEEMGVERMRIREVQLLELVFSRLDVIKNIQVLEADVKKRLGIVSFIVKNAHYNLFVKILDEKFQIQARGGCSCAGIYGHYLLQVNSERSHQILDAIKQGNMHDKPGWVRISIHPTMPENEVSYILDAIEQVALNYSEWSTFYTYDPVTNEFNASHSPTPEPTIPFNILGKFRFFNARV